MTDAQMVTLAVAILAVFAGTLFNNSRISDMKSLLSDRLSDTNLRISDGNRRTDDKIADVHRNIDDKFALLSRQMKTMEDNILRLIGDHQTRLQRLERRPDERAG
jgi:hypothetical protein